MPNKRNVSRSVADVIEISSRRNQDSILAFVRKWVALLADGHVDEACALIDEPNCYGIVWTPRLINDVINSTFPPNSRFYRSHREGPIVTNPYQLIEQRNLEVLELDEGSVYLIDYNLPLNGEWSDLTAQLEFHKRGQAYAVILHDLHVL